MTEHQRNKPATLILIPGEAGPIAIFRITSAASGKSR
jgi:hypothetical protein